MVNFMVEFARYVSSGDDRRKLWSHWGVIWSRSSNAPRGKFGWTRCPASPADIKAGGQWAFDPTNRVYGRVMNAIWPDLDIRLGWQFPASDETCGDCIEALIGVWLHCKDGWAPYSDDWRPTANCITLDRAAKYWENMSYIARRIFRVLDWNRITRTLGQNTGLRSFDDTGEMIIQKAIQWAGSCYRTTSQLHHAMTTPPHDNNVPQMTQLQPLSFHTMDGRPGSSNDVSQQSFASYLQSVQLRLQAEQLGDEESDHGRPGSIDDESPQSCASSPSTYYDWFDSPT
jgi:hypothetical protein